MTLQDPIRRMAARIERCRRLAATTTDERTASILRQMADEGEQDMRRLTTERENASRAGDSPEGDG